MTARFLRALATKPFFAWLGVMFIGSIILVENPWFGHQYFKNATGLAMLDMNPYNSMSDIISFVDSIGPAGRMSYRVLLASDFVLIITFFLFATAVLYRLLDANRLSSRFRWVLLLPVCRGVFDSLETGAMLINAAIYPEVIPQLVLLAVLSTPVKWLFFAANIAALAILAARSFLRRPKWVRCT